MTGTSIIEYRRHLILWQFLDQPELVQMALVFAILHIGGTASDIGYVAASRP